MVPSIMAYSKSGPPDNTLKRLSNTHFFAHRRKRLKVEFQFQLVWKVTPWRAGARHPEHRLQKQPVIRCRPAWFPRLARKKRRHLLPLRISQNQPTPCRLLSRQPSIKLSAKRESAYECQQALMHLNTLAAKLAANGRLNNHSS